MKCCLCNQRIEVIGTWKEGNSAQPLKDGRCCSLCNEIKVIPERLRQLFLRRVRRVRRVRKNDTNSN